MQIQISKDSRTYTWKEWFARYPVIASDDYNTNVYSPEGASHIVWLEKVLRFGEKGHVDFKLLPSKTTEI